MAMTVNKRHFFVRCCVYEIKLISQTSVERSDIMSKNVGRIDAYLRTSAGLMLISLGIMQKKGWMAALGSLKVATGVTRYCPILCLLDISTVCDEEILEDYLCSDDDQSCCCLDDYECEHDNFDYDDLDVYDEFEGYTDECTCECKH